jgi:hypothetical protein
LPSIALTSSAPLVTAQQWADREEIIGFGSITGTLLFAELQPQRVEVLPLKRFR